MLAKANPQQRAAYVESFQAWYDQVCRGELRLIYVDEVHLHQDLETGYRWSLTGVDDWVPSHCLSLSNRLNWYGAYDFTTGRGQLFLPFLGYIQGPFRQYQRRGNFHKFSRANPQAFAHFGG